MCWESFRGKTRSHGVDQARHEFGASVNKIRCVKKVVSVSAGSPVKADCAHTRKRSKEEETYTIRINEPGKSDSSRVARVLARFRSWRKSISGRFNETKLTWNKPATK